MGSYHRGGTFKLLACLCPKDGNLRRNGADIQAARTILKSACKITKSNSKFYP
jgi:hypothetical protein